MEGQGNRGDGIDGGVIGSAEAPYKCGENPAKGPAEYISKEPIGVLDSFINMPEFEALISLAARLDVAVGSLAVFSRNAEFVRRFIRSMNSLGGTSDPTGVLAVAMGDVIPQVGNMFPLVCDAIGQFLEYLDPEKESKSCGYQFGKTGTKILSTEIENYKRDIQNPKVPSFSTFSVKKDLVTSTSAVVRFLANRYRFPDIRSLVSESFINSFDNIKNLPIGDFGLGDELVDFVYSAAPIDPEADMYITLEGPFDFYTGMPKATLVAFGLLTAIFDKYIKADNVNLFDTLNGLYAACPAKTIENPVECAHLSTIGSVCYQDSGCNIFKRRVYCGTCFKISDLLD